MKAKHIPGPYEVRVHDRGPYFSEVEIWHQNYGLIARMPDNTSIWNSDKNEEAALEALNRTVATATIIAAAPELLEACRVALKCSGLLDPRFQVHFKTVKEAIKKATP